MSAPIRAAKHLNKTRPAETRAAASGSVAGLALWGLEMAGVTVPPNAAAGIVIIVGWVAAYVTRRVEQRGGE